MENQERGPGGAGSAPPAPHGPGWRRYLLLDLIVLVILGGGGFALVLALSQGGQSVVSQSALVVRPMIAVTTPVSGTLSTVSVAAGTTLRQGTPIAQVVTAGGQAIEVRAPSAGSVGQVLAAPGQAIGQGQAVVTEVADGRVQVIAMVAETAIDQVRPGQSASVTAQALPGQSLNGTVTSVWPQTAQAYIGQSGVPAPPAQEFLKQTALVPVSVTLPHPPGSLAGGESAEVTIHVG